MASFAVTRSVCRKVCIPTNAGPVSVLFDGTSKGLNGIPTVTLGFIVYLHLRIKQACYRRTVGKQFNATKLASLRQTLQLVCVWQQCVL
jgi:hypothetical protein